MTNPKIQVCTRCVMDSTDPDTSFDENGVCSNCKIADVILNRPPFSLNSVEKQKKLLEIVEKIKETGKKGKYDCIIGVSGGIDSSYITHKVKELGLRPLAVHFDNGWDSALAVKNVKLLLDKAQVDLYTYVTDWEEFKKLQLAFLRASIPDAEIPTDHAIIATLYQAAKKNGVKYVLLGANLATELVHPKAWSHGHVDWKYIYSINKIFGNPKLTSFPHFTFVEWLFQRFVPLIKTVTILDYMDYNKIATTKLLEEKYGWKYYGGKHYESIYTRFVSAYLLPVKFSFDKRKAQLSSLILSKQLSREEALEELRAPTYDTDDLKQDVQYVIKKLGISEEEFKQIMDLPKKTFYDYPSYEKSWYYGPVKKIFTTLRTIL
jgi:N-acetyl sugar amidotransferase